jgi:hypothetical protein
MSDEWPTTPDGKPIERRAIPIHILNHIDERLENHSDKVDRQLAAIRSDLQHNAEQSEERHRHLVDSITAFMGRAELLFDAFPEQDPNGHRRAHEEWVKEAAAKAEFWQTMKKELAKYGLLGLAGWVAFQLWTAFLHGPQK